MCFHHTSLLKLQNLLSSCIYCIDVNTGYDPYFFVQDKNEKEIVLKAMGQAISKAVAVGEIIKVC